MPARAPDSARAGAGDGALLPYRAAHKYRPGLDLADL